MVCIFESLFNFTVTAITFVPYLAVVSVFLILGWKKPFHYIMIISIYIAVVNSNLIYLDIRNGAQFFGFNVYTEDLFTFSTVCVSILMPLFAKKNREDSLAAISLPLKFLLLSLFLGVLSWVNEYGLKTGVNSWREPLFTLSIFYYCLKVPFLWERVHLKNLMIYPGGLLALITLIKFFTSGIGTSQGVDSNTGESLGRATTSLGAFMILIAFIGSYFLVRKSWLRTIFLIVCGFEILLLQHRTIWLVSLAGVVFFIALHNYEAAKQSRLAKFLTLMYLLFFTLIYSSFNQKLESAATDSNTWNWRTQRWAESLSTPRSIQQWIFGSTFGPTPVTTYGTRSEFSHNAYVNMVEYFGIMGLLLLLWILVLSYFAFGSNQTTKMARLVMLCAAIYGITYNVPIQFYLLFGILLRIQTTNQHIGQDSLKTTQTYSGDLMHGFRKTSKNQRPRLDVISVSKRSQ